MFDNPRLCDRLFAKEELAIRLEEIPVWLSVAWLACLHDMCSPALFVPLAASFSGTSAVLQRRFGES